MGQEVKAEAGEERALKQYDAFLRYLAYENTVYWSRSQFFLVAQAALFGFLVSTLTRSSTPLQETPLLVLQGCLCLIGFAMCYLWHRAILAGEFWIAHWHDILKVLEPKALGGIRAFEFETHRVRIPARPITRWSMRIFLLAWFVATGAVFSPHVRQQLCGA